MTSTTTLRPPPAAPARASSAAPASPAGGSLRGAVLTTPVGPLAVVSEATGTVRAAGFAALDVLVARLLRQEPGAVVEDGPASALPASLRDAVARFVDGDAAALDGVPVRQAGGPFRQDAWAAMRRVPAGETVTYARLAEMAGRPTAVRAAGSACAVNLVAPFVPCHRVLRTDGTLGGYAYGLGVKRALLAFERGERDALLWP